MFCFSLNFEFEKRTPSVFENARDGAGVRAAAAWCGDWRIRTEAARAQRSVRTTPTPDTGGILFRCMMIDGFICTASG